MQILMEALLLAAEAHKKQRRDGATRPRVPYINHCIRVAYKVSQYTSNETLLAAALLHDTLEDTDLRPEIIESMCGKRVLSLVRELTQDDLDHLPHEEKKQLQVAHVRQMSPEAKLIKSADRLDNLGDMDGWTETRVQRFYEITEVMLPILAEDNPQIPEIISEIEELVKLKQK